MYPGAAGRHEIAIYPHIEGRFPYRNGGVFRIRDMVAGQRCTGDRHQEQGARFVATRQPVAFKFEVTFHIDVDGTTADFVFHDAQRVYPDAIGQHYTAYFAVPDIEQLPAGVREQAQRMECISLHPDAFPPTYQFECAAGHVTVGRDISAPPTIWRSEGRGVGKES